ncbi:hypothetical protein L1887_34436 [Cichorium endivia]|nr:hypothetical protein L1887_34436 [Cichorium endivia]
MGWSIINLHVNPFEHTWVLPCLHTSRFFRRGCLSSMPPWPDASFRPDDHAIHAQLHPSVVAPPAACDGGFRLDPDIFVFVAQTQGPKSSSSIIPRLTTATTGEPDQETANCYSFIDFHRQETTVASFNSSSTTATVSSPAAFHARRPPPAASPAIATPTTHLLHRSRMKAKTLKIHARHLYSQLSVQKHNAVRYFMGKGPSHCNPTSDGKQIAISMGVQAHCAEEKDMAIDIQAWIPEHIYEILITKFRSTTWTGVPYGAIPATPVVFPFRNNMLYHIPLLLCAA